MSTLVQKVMSALLPKADIGSAPVGLRLRYISAVSVKRSLILNRQSASTASLHVACLPAAHDDTQSYANPTFRAMAGMSALGQKRTFLLVRIAPTR